MKIAGRMLTIAALVLSHLMCAVVAYKYRDMLCGIAHASYSAPAEAAFLTPIPFLLGIIACLVVANLLHKKAK